MSDYSWTGSGFTTRTTPSSTSGWSKWGSWKSGFKKYKSSLGYGESSFYDYSRGSYYNQYHSSYTNPKNREEVEKLLVSAYKSVREAVVILDFPFKVDICFSSHSFFNKKKDSNVRKIFLATKCLNNRTISDADKIDIICGTGIHEASHLKYTELRVLKSFYKRDYDNKKLIEIFANLLEDERVEDKLLQERPGYLGYITKKKEHDVTQLPTINTCSTVANIIKDIVLYIRYRDKLTESSIINSYPNIISDLDAVLSSNPITSTKETCHLGKLVVDTIVSSLKKVFDEIQVSEGIDIIEQSYDKYFNPATSGFDESIAPTPLNQDMLQKKETSLCGSGDLKMFEDLGEGDKERFSDSIFIKITPSDVEIERYDAIKKEISKYVPALRNTLISSYKNYDFTIPSCRSGLLDTNKLAEAYQGVPQVYCRQGHVRTNGAVICVLIDESGSMSSCVGCSWSTPKYSVARAAGILLNEAFGSIPGVSLFIYGHTADQLEEYSTEVRIYKEPGTKSNPKALGAVMARCENRDGTAILSVAKRIRKFTSQRCTFFVISDGLPSAGGYRGLGAIDDTASKIKLVRDTMDMDIIGVCIDHVPEMQKMYGDKFINLYTDISKFPSLLGNLIKQSISENRNTTIS